MQFSPVECQDSKMRRDLSASVSLILGCLIVTVNVGLEVQAAVFVYP